MKIIKDWTEYEFSLYYTDAGIYIKLNHGHGRLCQIRITITENGKQTLQFFLGYKETNGDSWSPTMLADIANRLVANNGAEIIRQVFTEYRGLVRL